MTKHEMSAPHDSAITHVTGQSEYIDDRPMYPGELFVGCFYSTLAHAEITTLDVSAAMKVPGVVTVVTADDVHHNLWGPIFVDQPIIAKDKVTFAGEVIALVGAESPEALRQGLRAIKVSFKRLPAVMSISDAIVHSSFIGGERRIHRGQVNDALDAAPHRLTSKLVIQGADHFYLENQSAVAYPKEQGQIEVHSSTQHPTETQHTVAHALGIHFSDVICLVKRLGGGFGGKESQASPIAAYAALVAQKAQRPARLVLCKDDDMIMTGKRNPFEIHYDVGFDQNGKILALRSKLYSDGGAYADLSTAIMERAMLHSDNAYFIPHIEIIGQVCRTNNHPHTAFRGFGGPKGVAAIEGIIEDIAQVLKRDALDIRQTNVYRLKQDKTPYGQTVENNLLPELFEELASTCNYRERRQEISAHNKLALASPDKFSPSGQILRGLSLTAVKFGISFTTRFLNQGNALVILHRDGSLQVSTGAVEMGQGVNSRIAALVSEELGIPLSHVRIMATSTEKNANTPPTAASTGTDINGAAAINAARKIKVRLASLAIQLSRVAPERWPSKSAALGTAPEINIDKIEPEEAFRQTTFSNHVVKVPDAEFQINLADLAVEAYLNRTSLSEYGFHRTENLGFDKLTGQGQAFHYFTQGVAASEVDINRMTGEVKVRRVDILMDLGRPINEALDLGQVTGGFVQGMGWLTTENLVYNEEGLLLSHSPSTYKIPSIQDTPRVFHVRLAHNLGNEVNIRGTKAVGEPPLLLSISVWTAIKNAIACASENNPDILNFNRKHPLQIPATAEETLRHLDPLLFKSLTPSPSANR